MAKANKIDLEIVETQTSANAPADYLKYNKLGKIPTFVGADGYVLSECIAIAIYSESLFHFYMVFPSMMNKYKLQLSLSETSC